MPMSQPGSITGEPGFRELAARACSAKDFDLAKIARKHWRF
jgi:hypothetical protein